ncbi:MAG TPA: site-2 protease family protein [Gemmataceae bacterium]|nr:site-2 protease family protein [Gemmataceae bacterium]
MFFEPNRSPYDLNFRLFRIDIRVHPMFWLVSLIMGWNALEDGFGFLLVWVFCVFVSVLVHEMGHVFMGRLFGSHGHIVLYSFGGLAIGSSALRNRWQRIAVYFAGPLAGFLLFGLVWWAARQVDLRMMSPLVTSAVFDLVVINLFWGFLNLLPIWPLDGGQISRDVCEWLTPANGIRVAMGISLVVAGLLAFIALINTYSTEPPAIIERLPYLDFLHGGYMILLFACLAFNSYQVLQVEGRRKPSDHEWDNWER